MCKPVTRSKNVSERIHTVRSYEFARCLDEPRLCLRQPRLNEHFCFVAGGAEGVGALVAEVEVGEEGGGAGVVFCHHCRASEAGLWCLEC
jgi:hypothetical protein